MLLTARVLTRLLVVVSALLITAVPAMATERHVTNNEMCATAEPGTRMVNANGARTQLTWSTNGISWTATDANPHHFRVTIYLTDGSRQTVWGPHGSWTGEGQIDRVKPCHCPQGAADSPAPGRDPIADPGTEPGRDPVTDPVEDPVTDPVEDPVTDPVEDPVTDPVEEPVTDPAPVVEDPITDPVEDPISDPVEEPVTDPAPVVEDPITDPVEEPVTDPAPVVKDPVVAPAGGTVAIGTPLTLIAEPAVEVLGVEIANEPLAAIPAPAAGIQALPALAAQAETLPVTGIDSDTAAVAGLGLLIVGGALLLGARRRQSQLV